MIYQIPLRFKSLLQFHNTNFGLLLSKTDQSKRQQFSFFHQLIGPSIIRTHNIRLFTTMKPQKTTKPQKKPQKSELYHPKAIDIKQGHHPEYGPSTLLLTIYHQLPQQREKDQREAFSQSLIDMENEGLQIQNSIKNNTCIQNFEIEYNEVGSIVYQEPYQQNLSRELYPKLTYSQKISIGFQLAEALLDLQKAGIVHRNIIPSNISICSLTKKSVKIKLNGFRNAAFLDQVQEYCYIPIQTEYCAPEVRISDKWGFESDIWSFGMILFEMLFSDIKLVHVIEDKVTIEFPEECPGWIKNFLDSILVQKPKERYSIKSIISVMKSAQKCAESAQKFFPNFFEQKPKKRRLSNIL